MPRKRSLTNANGSLHVRDAATTKLQHEFEQQKLRLEAKEAEIEDRYRNGMQAIQTAQSMMKAGPLDRGSAAVGKYLRERHVQGTGFGGLITATYLADRTGFIRLAWAVQINLPLPPLVEIRRDNKTIRTDASFAGEHPDHIIPGRRYLYHFAVFDDRGKNLGEPLRMEVKIPLAEDWDGQNTPSQDEHFQQIREKFTSRYGGLKVVEESDKPFTRR